MGINISRHQCKSKSDKFHVSDDSKAADCVTKCETPSFHFSVKNMSTKTPSEAFIWGQMQSLYLLHEPVTVENLTSVIITGTLQVFELLKRQLGHICNDIQNGTSKMPDALFDKFAACMKVNNPMIAVRKKIIVHFVPLLYLHDMILSYFRDGKTDLALDLINQVAVSHALVGVAVSDFRMMDLFFIHYLIQHKVTSDENINSFTLYLVTVSNYIDFFYKSQTVRHNMLKKIISEDPDDRYNKARENYRLMKKWKKQVDGFYEQEQYVEELLFEEMRRQLNGEDQQSFKKIG